MLYPLSHSPTNLKRTYRIGLVAYGILLLLAVVFYKERIVFLDAAFAVFHMVKDGDFAIQIYRVGDGFARLLPHLAYRFGLSLQAICLTYSVGFTLVFAVCYWVCGTWLKRPMWAVIILLMNVLFVAHSFYWPTAQVPQGIALLMVVCALFDNRPFATVSVAQRMVAAVLLLIVAFFHPLLVVCIAWMIVWFALRGQSPFCKKAVLYMVGILVAGVLVKMLFFRVPYERHSVSGLKNFIRLFPHYFDTYTNHQFLYRLFTIYYWMPVVLVLVAARYVVRRQYWLLVWYAATIMGYLFLVNTMYPNADTAAFYLEVLYLPVGVFMGLPFVFDVLPGITARYATVLVVLIVATGCWRIYDVHGLYSQRLQWQRNFLQQYGDRKMIVDTRSVDTSLLQMSWGTPYEFWLLSTMEQGRSASIIIDNRPADRQWTNEKRTHLVVNWNIFPYSELNPKYFRFADTVKGYEIGPEL